LHGLKPVGVRKTFGQMLAKPLVHQLKSWRNQGMTVFTAAKSYARSI